MVDKLRAALNVIEGGFSAIATIKMGHFDGLLKSAELILDEAAAMAVHGVAVSAADTDTEEGEIPSSSSPRAKRPREFAIEEEQPKKQYKDALEPKDHVFRPIEESHVCLTPQDEDFIIHARDQAAPGAALESGLVKSAALYKSLF